MRAVLFALFFALFVSGCTTVNSVHLTNLSVPTSKSRRISAEVTKLTFLGFSASNDYAFEVREKLYAACPGGTVTGVLSTFESTLYVVLVEFKVRARGFCHQ